MFLQPFNLKIVYVNLFNIYIFFNERRDLEDLSLKCELKRTRTTIYNDNDYTSLSLDLWSTMEKIKMKKKKKDTMILVVFIEKKERSKNV